MSNKKKTTGVLDGMMRTKEQMSPVARKAFVTTLVRTTVALELGNIMQKSGITQRQLAEKMELTEQRISQIMNGNSNLSLDSLARIADALGKELKVSFV